MTIRRNCFSKWTSLAVAGLILASSSAVCAQTYYGPNNTKVHYGANGRLQLVQARGMTIVHLPDGTREVVAALPDLSLIVTNNAGHGYVQRPYVVRDVTCVQRTYFVGGVPYKRVYRPYVWGSMTVNLYAPVRFYSPGFYIWAYNPWAVPVVYGWGWKGSPWYGFYGGWFTPYQSYPQRQPLAYRLPHGHDPPAGLPGQAGRPGCHQSAGLERRRRRSVDARSEAVY